MVLVICLTRPGALPGLLLLHIPFVAQILGFRFNGWFHSLSDFFHGLGDTFRGTDDRDDLVVIINLGDVDAAVGAALNALDGLTFGTNQKLEVLAFNGDLIFDPVIMNDSGVVLSHEVANDSLGLGKSILASNQSDFKRADSFLRKKHFDVCFLLDFLSGFSFGAN